MSRRGLVSARRSNATVAQTVAVNGIAALTTAGLTVQNTTPATVGEQVQRAPSVWQYGTGWDTDDAVSRVFGMGWQMRPVAGNTVTGAMHLMRDLAGTVADAGLRLTSAGALDFNHGQALITSLESGGTARTLLSWGTTGNNELLLGVFGVANNFSQIHQSGGVAWYAGSSNIFSINNTRVELKRDELRFQNDTTAPRIYAQTATSGAGVPIIYGAGDTSAAAATGGAVFVRTGAPGAGGTGGTGSLQAIRNGGTLDTALSWSTSGSAPTLGFYTATPVARQADVGAAPTDTVANLAAWAETLRTVVRNIGITA